MFKFKEKNVYVHMHTHTLSDSSEIPKKFHWYRFSTAELTQFYMFKLERENSHIKQCNPQRVATTQTCCAGSWQLVLTWVLAYVQISQPQLKITNLQTKVKMIQF